MLYAHCHHNNINAAFPLLRPMNKKDIPVACMILILFLFMYYSVPATIVSLTPKEPLYLSGSSSIIKVKVPTGYMGTVLTCIGMAWPPPQGVLWLNSTADAIAGSTRILNTRFISAELRFEEFMIADAGEYTCVVLGNSTYQAKTIKLEHTETAVTTVQRMCEQNREIVNFLFRVRKIPCKMWPKGQLLMAEANILDTISAYITSQCGDYDSQITIDQTSCSASVQRAIVFRGRIISMAINKEPIFCELLKWQLAGSLVYLTNPSMLFQVDRDCAFETGPDGHECIHVSADTSTIAAFSTGAVVFMLILIISAIAGGIGSLMRRRYIAVKLYRALWGEP